MSRSSASCRPLVDGRGVAAFGLTEPGGGSDAAALQTTAVERDGTYFLNGSKMFITNASVAQNIVVFATQDRGLGYKGVSAFIVEKGSPGLTINPMHGKLGMRSSTTDEIVFQDTPVASTNLLGEEGRGFNQAMEILTSSRIIIAAQSTGIGQSALESALRYAQQRQTFGQPIAQHQAIQFMLADMAAEVHAARVVTMNAATLKDAGEPFLQEASIAKLLASEMCIRAADKALQIHGGSGLLPGGRGGTNPARRPGHHHLRGHIRGAAAAHCAAVAEGLRYLAWKYCNQEPYAISATSYPCSGRCLSKRILSPTGACSMASNPSPETAPESGAALWLAVRPACSLTPLD